MHGAILVLIIIAPISGFIGCYKCFNHGKMPCIDTSNIDTLNQVVPEE